MTSFQDAPDEAMKLTKQTSMFYYVQVPGTILYHKIKVIPNRK